MMGMLQQLQTALPPWAFEFLKFGNGLILLVVLFVPLERVFALKPQRVLREGWRTDVVYYFLTSILPGKIIVVPVIAALWLMHMVAPQGLAPSLADWPGWARFAFSMIVAEFGFYWGHRAMHASALLWRFHAVHHSAHELDWLVNTRAHPVDLILVRLCGYLPLYLLGLAQPAGSTLDWVPLLVTLVGSTWGYVLHANLRWPLAWCERIVATPAFHHWHHEHLGAGVTENANYAATLPLFDMLFGTFRASGAQWPERYGIDEKQPSALIDQVMAPFMGALEAYRKPGELR